MKKHSIHRDHIDHYLLELFRPHLFQDYGPNGLQVEGKDQISRIAFAISCSRQTVETAVEKKADALIVHHGILWKGQWPTSFTGPYSRRLFPLIRHEINLWGYHLPLDAHPEIGNATAIANALDLRDRGPFGDHKGMPVGVMGHLPKGVKAKTLAKKLTEILSHDTIVSAPDDARDIHSVGIITGGASGEWRHALDRQLDAYITGEVSEHDWFEAQESDMQLFACGHTATEEIGVKALMERMQYDLGVECVFIPSPNPV